MTRRTLTMTEPLYQYMLKTALREPPVLQALREKTGALPQEKMQIAPEQGQFMAFLLELMQAKRVIEIGTFTGYSALWMALALPETGQLITCDISDAQLELAAKFWQTAGVADKITFKHGEAKQTLTQLLTTGQAGQFDFAFIDADKENYDDYFEQCYQLVRPQGVIALDNMLWGGKVADPQINDASTCAIRALSKKLLQDERITLSLLPIADGLTLAMKR